MQIQRPTATTTSSAQISTLLPHASKKKEIDFKKLYQELQEKGFRPIENRYGQQPGDATLDAAPKKVYVEWGSAVVGIGPVLLGTDGMSSCSALNIIDPAHDNIHYMLHAYPRTKPGTIKISLEKAKALGINLKDSEIEVMPGYSLNSESTPHILEGLYLTDSNLLDKALLIRDYARKHKDQAIIVCEGKTFGLDVSASIPTDQTPTRGRFNPVFDPRRFEKDGVEVVLTGRF